MTPQGTLIAFESLDGGGKFTQITKTRAWLEEFRCRIAVAAEPNDDPDAGTPLGKTIRKMLKGELPAEEAIRRIAKVRENYLRARYAKPFAGNVAVINGNQSEEKVFEAVKAAFAPLIAPRAAPRA